MFSMKRIKVVLTLLIFLVALILLFLICAIVRINIKTKAIQDDFTSVYTNDKYHVPVYVDGVEVITQDISCGYAVIEMFSAWNGGDITEEALYNQYGKVITSNGDSFCEEMNKQFPAYTTTIHKWMKNSDLIDALYNNLAGGIPVPVEWAALYGDEWTLHYSLVIGLDIPNDIVTVANPYGYIEKISLEDFLNRTSFEAYEDMPWFFKLAFAVGLFEKNTIFTIDK